MLTHINIQPFSPLIIKFLNRGWGIRTPIDGFGDRCSTIELIPYNHICFDIPSKPHTLLHPSTLLPSSFGSFDFALLLFLPFFPVSSCCLWKFDLALPCRTTFARFACSGQTLDRLVAVSSIHYCTSTSALSTSSSSRGLTPFGWDISSWGGLHA